MIVLRVDRDVDVAVLRALKATSMRFPGDQVLRVLCGDRVLTFGASMALDSCDACMAALREFGDADVVAG